MLFLKEIIYLDIEIMNSLLAQLDEGIVNNFTLEQSSQITEGEETGSIKGKTAGLSGGLNFDTGLLPGGSFGINGTMGHTGDENENYSRGILEGQKDILNKAFHDYALNILLQKLKENDLLAKNDTVMTEGDLFLGESTYRFYDFDLIRKSVDHKALEEIMLFDVNNSNMDINEARRIHKKKKPSARERKLKETARLTGEKYDNNKTIINIIKNFNTISSFGSQLLEGLTLIKANNKIGLMKKNFLRESVEALSFRTDKSRKIKYLVRIIGEKEYLYDGSNLPMFDVEDLDVIPNMMLDIILGSFDTFREGDLLVTPIAIFYE